MKFNKAKCKVLHLGRGKPRCQQRLSNEGIASSPAEKDLGVLVDENLDMSHQCALAAQKVKYPGLHQKQRGQQVEAGDSAPLLSSGEIPTRALHPALEPSVQKRHGPVEAGLEEGHKNDQRLGTHLL